MNLKNEKKTDELAASFGSSCRVMDRSAVQHSANSISATRAVVSPATARAYSLEDSLALLFLFGGSFKQEFQS
jgi:hypothetical protein